MVHILAAQVPLYTEFLACVATASARGRRENWKGGRRAKREFSSYPLPLTIIVIIIIIFLPKVCLLTPSVPKISDTLDNSNTFFRYQERRVIGSRWYVNFIRLCLSGEEQGQPAKFQT